MSDNNLYGFLLQRDMFSISINTLPWTFAKKPLVRHLRPANSSPSAIMDALDLASNFRGHGWNWSGGLPIPRETRPTNRIAFASYALLSVVIQAFIGAAVYQAMHLFTTGVAFNTEVPTIFDKTLPFIARYIRASIISALAAWVTYSGMQLKYNLLAVIGILLFRQDPAQWPPIFDSPWWATSLNDLWSRRWHQVYRHTFLVVAYPFSVAFGRVGGIVGAFLASALFHHVMMATFECRPEFWRMLIGFGMMGLGMLAERAFYKLTGRKVDGVVGWIWTMMWLLLWGNVIVDGFARAGMFAQSTDIDTPTPLGMSVDKLVRDFDSWLHTI